jgi:hypothetical protein
MENESESEREIVSALLAIAGITAPEDEVRLLAGLYRAHRADLARLSRIATGDDAAVASPD